MLPENKNAILYGAGGSIGGAVAREFAREEVKVFLAGRTHEKIEVVARDIEAAGGSVEVAVLDALEEQAVDERALAMVARAGSIDISFNLITRGDVHEIPLVDMEVADFVRPVTTGITTAAHLE